MKTLLLGAAGAVVVLGSGVAVANHYDNYKTKTQAQTVSQVEQAKRAQYNTDKALYQPVVNQNKTLQAECEKGAAAYAKLSALVQKQTPAPQCGPATAN